MRDGKGVAKSISFVKKHAFWGPGGGRGGHKIWFWERGGSNKIDNNILVPKFFDPKLTRTKKFQTERTQSLRIFRAFANSF